MTLRGSLSLERKLVAVTPAAGTAPDGAPGAPVALAVQQQDPTYFQKLVNLFPAEAVTLYGTGVAIFAGANIGVILVCLAILLVLRYFATQPTGGGTPHYVAMAVAAIAFLLWATALDAGWMEPLLGSRTPEELTDVSKWASFLGAAFVFLAPFLLQPRPAPAVTP